MLRQSSQHLQGYDAVMTHYVSLSEAWVHLAGLVLGLFALRYPGTQPGFLSSSTQPGPCSLSGYLLLLLRSTGELTC